MTTAEPALHGARGALRERITCIAGAIVHRQVDDAEAARYAEPDKVRGTWLQFGITQMDDQQHTLSALLAAREVLTDLTAVPKKDPLPTNAWLAALAALAALHPLRLACGSAGTPRERRRSVGIAGGLVTLVVGLLAAVGGPLLRALDVSTANGLIAAAVVLVGGGIYCFANQNEAEPGGVAVPLLIPLGLRPDLLLFAVVAGAGGRGPVVTAAVALGSVAGALLAGLDRPRAVIRAWIGRVVGTVGIATALALLVDGVYGI